MNPSDNAPPLSDELIQRLADGELSGPERRELLQRIDEEEPDRWRDLALALLEAKLLAEAFRHAESILPVSAPVSWQRRTLAIAAAILLGAFFATVFIPRSTEKSVVKDIHSAAAPTSPELSYRNLRVTGLDPDEFQIPVLQSNGPGIGAGDALHAATAPVREMQQAFTDHGVDSSLATSYVTADLEDGRRLVIPVSRLSTSGNALVTTTPR